MNQANRYPQGLVGSMLGLIGNHSSKSLTLPGGHTWKPRGYQDFTKAGEERFLFRARELEWKSGRNDLSSYAALKAAAWCGVEREDAVNLLVNFVRDLGHVPDQWHFEIQSHAAYDQVQGVKTGEVKGEKHRPWPVKDYPLIEAIAREWKGKTILEEESPFKFDPKWNYTDFLVRQFFPGNPLICVGQNNDDARTEDMEWWGENQLRRKQFIVPSRMIARRGATKKKKLSFRSLGNVGNRDNLVIEFDFKKFDLDEDGQPTIPRADLPMLESLEADGITIGDLSCGLHRYLATKTRLAMVIFSGSKSYHGWYPTYGRSEEEMRKVMSHACSIGADHMTFTRCQFIRMPDGRRANGVRQTVHYFDPSALVKSEVRP